MVRIIVDIPIFASPTEAYGHVVGEMEIDNLPEPAGHLPWPAGWMQAHPSYFAPEQSLIASVSAWPFNGPSHLLMMYGIVCESVEDARKCAKFFERMANFEINEYSI